MLFKGFDYEHSNLQLASLHKLQHKYDNFGRLNKRVKILLLIEFCFITNLIRYYIIQAYRVLFQ